MANAWNPGGWVLLCISLASLIGAGIATVWRGWFLYKSGASGRLNIQLKEGKRVLAKVEGELNHWTASRVVAIKDTNALDEFTQKLYKWKVILKTMEGHLKLHASSLLISNVFLTRSFICISFFLRLFPCQITC